MQDLAVLAVLWICVLYGRWLGSGELPELLTLLLRLSRRLTLPEHSAQAL